MRWLLVLPLAAVIAMPAMATTLSDYDGNYTGALVLKPGMDGPACSSQDVKSLHVANGQIQATAGMPSLSGTISATGEVDGHLRKADGGDLTFQGRADITEHDSRMQIMSVVIDEKTGCGWSLNLTHD